MRNLEGEPVSSESGGNGSQQYMQPSQSQHGRAQYSDYSGAPGVDTSAQTGTLPPNIAAMLAYLLFGWVGGLIMYLTQKDREVRFHAAQSILTFGGLTVIWVGVDICFSLMFVYTGLVLFWISWLVSMLSFVLWIFLSIQGYQLKHTKLPIVGAIAEQWAAK